MKKNADRAVAIGNGADDVAVVMHFLDKREPLLQVRPYGYAGFVSEEDCLRAVLCWNACIGMSNEKLSRLIAGREPISNMKMLVVDVQREEILKVLNELVESLAVPTPTDPTHSSYVRHSRQVAAFESAVATLRKYRDN